MHIASFGAVVGAVLLATAGAVQAGERFDTIGMVPAVGMSGSEMSQVAGAGPATEAALLVALRPIFIATKLPFLFKDPFSAPLTAASIKIGMGIPSP